MSTDSAPVTIRETLVPADVESVRRITAETGFFHPPEVDVAVELAEANLEKGEASGYYFLIAESSRPIGFACYGPIACTAGSFDLYWIVVDRAAQGHGIGRRLLQESERRIEASGGRRVYIETSSRPLYEPTRAFYLRCGYEVAAVLDDFYAPGDGKVIFVKRLDAPRD